MFAPTCLFISLAHLVVFIGVASHLPAAHTGTLGLFSDHNDVGSVSRPSLANFDPVSGTYTLGASGANMWGEKDAFGYVWKQMTGDVALAANIRFIGTSSQGHRKACLVFRQSLDAGSTYVDVAVHGDGLASLQFRNENGGLTRTIQCPVNAPQRVRLEKRGAVVTFAVAGKDGVYSPSGCVTMLALNEPFYVGLGVCAHDDAAFETATFSAVELGTPPALPVARTYALEVLAMASGDREVVFRAGVKMDSPHFSADGSALYFNREGRIERVKRTGGEMPELIDTGFATHCINDHGISPDGAQLAISDLTETGKSRMYLLPVGGGTPRRIDVPEPALWHGWSPDGRTLAYGAQRDGDYDVYTVAVAGGWETRLTTAPGNDNGPDYSADGRWIYFHSVRSGRFQIWRMHANGSNQEQVTNDEYFNWFPHPSPDGKWIAILSSKVVPDTGHPPDGEYVLRLIPTAGGAPREIAKFFAGNGSFNVPCWSRDSLRLAFASYGPGM